jgi:hypothetical protein
MKMKFHFVLESGKEHEIIIPVDTKIYRALLYIKDGKQVAIGIPEDIKKIYISD